MREEDQLLTLQVRHTLSGGHHRLGQERQRSRVRVQRGHSVVQPVPRLHPGQHAGRKQHYPDSGRVTMTK